MMSLVVQGTVSYGINSIYCCTGMTVIQGTVSYGIVFTGDPKI